MALLGRVMRMGSLGRGNRDAVFIIHEVYVLLSI
jgi:hypothetical protein